MLSSNLIDIDIQFVSWNVACIFLLQTLCSASSTLPVCEFSEAMGILQVHDT